MSKDIRILFITILACFLVVFVFQIISYNAIVNEVRVGDGHVASDIGQHNDMVMKH